MYAIVEIAGHQYKVEKDQQLYVNRLEGKEGAKLSFDNVLLIDNNGKVNVGAPVIKGAKVTAKIVSHLKGDKVIVFKKKRRKGYKVKNGHRQYLTELQIEKIEEKAAATKAAAPKAEEKKTEAKAEKPAVKKAPAAKKPAAEKKAPAKKTETTAKKAPAKKAAPKKTDDK